MKEYRVGVVGYCPPTKFDESKAREMIIDAYDKVDSLHQHDKIVIVSGLCAVGVLKIAYEEAARRNWMTVGIACAKAKDHPWFPVNEQKIIGTNWGDESETFLTELDAIIRIGLGKQSIKETEETKRRGKPTFEYDLPTL